MPSLKLNVLESFDDLRASGLARPAAEKFAGAWVACFLLMARGEILGAFMRQRIFCGKPEGHPRVTSAFTRVCAALCSRAGLFRKMLCEHRIANHCRVSPIVCHFHFPVLQSQRAKTRPWQARTGESQNETA